MKLSVVLDSIFCYIVIVKVTVYGIDKNMPCDIYYSYLKNRRECVSVNSMKSSFIEIMPGVRQGSADKTYSI